MKFAEVVQGMVPVENGWQLRQPRLSVILPTYNRHSEGRLLPCIQSVLEQSFADFELIIYDDGSEDGTGELIHSLAEKDPRIVFIPLARNTGLPAVLVDDGILRSRGEYTAFTFDDNVLHPRALEQLLAAAESSQADVVHAGLTMLQSDGRSRPLGKSPVSLASLELNNTIPNGAVLVRRSFWQRFGLYDPHLLLRRVCDWDLWLRALKQGAYFFHLPVEIGTEFGLTLKTSLGNSVNWDYQVVAAYLQDENTLPIRTDALLPDAIADYEVLDTERVLPYIRNWAEWDAYESKMVQPFLERHPQEKYAGVARNNRRFDTALQPFRLNASRPIFHPRKRILLVCEQYTRLADEWRSALADDPGHIVIVSTPGSAVLFDPAELDQVIIYDTAPAILVPFLGMCRRAGTSLVFVTGRSQLPAEFEPLAGLCDDAFSMQEKVNGPALNATAFLPCPLPGVSADVLPDLAIFSSHLLDADLLKSLANRSVEEPLWFFCPPGDLPTLPATLAGTIRVVQTAEAFSQLAKRLPHKAWFVSPEALVELTSYERALLDEDVLRMQGILMEWENLAALPTHAEIAERYQQDRSAWEASTVGYHPMGRQMQLRNLAAGTALRARLARQHGKKRGRDAHSLVFVNSRLFGGSEVYGFLTAWTLNRIGFSVQTCIPDFDHYGAGGAKMAEWLAEHELPAPTNAQYGETGRLFFYPEFNPDQIFQQSRPLAEWIRGRNADLVFCSGFIPEPILANGGHLPLFAAFFPPWGYALDRMTFLRGYLDGLASDSNWGLQLWGRWLPEPRSCIPSLIESGRFQVLNQDLPAQPVQIALVGTMMNMKGHRQALLAVEQLLSEGHEIHLNIYGFELEMYADFIRQTKKLAERPQLKGHVTFHGFVNDAMEINRQNHIVLSASLAEGLPQALAFHQAAGLLPVACPAGGIPEIVQEGQTGYLANGFEVPDIVQALRRALYNRADWPRLIENGRQLLVETCSEPVFVARLLAWMERGLDIRFSEGRNYFNGESSITEQAASSGAAVDKSNAQYKTPVLAAIPDESRMTCSPALASAPLIYQFECPNDRLDHLRLRMASFLSNAVGELHVEIYSSDGHHLLRRVVVPASNILDNAWMEISFTPLHNLLGRSLEVHISARLQQGRLAVYESPAQVNHSDFLLRLGRRFLPLPGRRDGQAFFSGEAG